MHFCKKNLQKLLTFGILYDKVKNQNLLMDFGVSIETLKLGNFNKYEYEDENNKISNIKDSINPRKIYESNRLNDFGKHPGYRKKVMSLPKTGSDNENGYYDWNDDSVYSEQPFGEKIGSSAPFEKAINSTVDSIVESLKKKL